MKVVNVFLFSIFCTFMLVRKASKTDMSVEQLEKKACFLLATKLAANDILETACTSHDF